MTEKTIREQRIRKITNLYYSNPEIQRNIFEFCKNRESIPRYFEGFGKRPDAFEYSGDVFELVKKGATSFHCSEEIWKNPMKIETGMNEKQSNELREGWDLLIDIDSKYLDYSKIMTILIIKILKFHGIKNIGIKFSGSKGFHIIVPWRAFPKEVNGILTKDKFPDWPRIITRYITEKIKEKLIEKISELTRPNKYIKDFQAPKEVIPDLVLVSPRHLFRTPYSLHEKTALASVVLDLEDIENFDMKNANPMTVKIRNFIPDVEEGEAKELLISALDWHQHNEPKREEKNKEDFKQIKISNLSEKNFPPCIKKISEGLSDGRQRSLFVLISLFRSLGIDRDEVEKRIYDWNEKNKPPLKLGIIKAQIKTAYRGKPLMPPNCKEYYSGIGVCQPDNFCKLIKNPVNYIIRKTFISSKKNSKFKKNKKHNKF